MRLTDLQIKRMHPPKQGQRTVFDDALPGFGVRISQGGSKSFVVMYGKKRHLKTIGRYPALTLAEARKDARRLLVELQDSDGLQPANRKVSFSEARSRFLADSKTRNKPRTYHDYTRLLTKHFAFNKGIDQVKRSDIMSSVESLARTPSEQRHAFVAIRVMMNWCERHGLIERSPVPRMSVAQTARNHILPDPDLRSVWLRAQDYGNPFGSIVHLLILTGQRRGEIAELRRSWIEDDQIVFPEGFTKNKREHRVPLSAKAQDILRRLPDTGDLFFPARGRPERCFNGWGKSKSNFDQGLEVAPYVLHDLRRSFSSNMARIGTPIYVTERILNHISGSVSGVAAIYNRYNYLDEMRAAVARHDDFLTKLLDDG